MTGLKQSGFTLIEVLISVFVLAIGVIGAAGMQSIALRTSQQSAFQSTAIALASEIADKMRTNDRQLKLDDRTNPFLDIDFQAAKDAIAAPRVSCYAASCSAEELAIFDIYEWKARVKTALPGARVRVCRDARPWDSAAGALTWACTATAANSHGASLVVKIGWQGKGRNPDGSVTKDANKFFPPSMAITVAPYTQ
jgi:type IV pilus assembly protein PilV